MKDKIVWAVFFYLFFIFSKSLPLHLFPTPPLPPSLMLQSRTKGKVKDELLLIDWKVEGEWKVFFEGGGGGQMVFRENGEWNQSSPTEYKEDTIETYQPINYQWGEN